MADWATVVGTLGGVFLGRGLALVKDWLMNAKKEKEEEQKRRRANLEQLHLWSLEYESNVEI
jgi:membrane protein YqaA with SNARE-associated domain